jgi:hypothetical protein
MSNPEAEAAHQTHEVLLQQLREARSSLLQQIRELRDELLDLGNLRVLVFCQVNPFGSFTDLRRSYRFLLRWRDRMQQNQMILHSLKLNKSGRGPRCLTLRLKGGPDGS